MDWHAWEREFKAYIATYDLTNKFFGKELFLARPIQPKISDYPTQVQRRSQSSVADSRAVTRATYYLIAELIAKGKESFKYDFMIY